MMHEIELDPEDDDTEPEDTMAPSPAGTGDALPADVRIALYDLVDRALTSSTSAGGSLWRQFSGLRDAVRHGLDVELEGADTEFCNLVRSLAGFESSQ